jgi:hypothetical protein
MSTNQITLSKACEGMIRYKQATGKSDHTISDYRVTFKKLFLYFPNDPPIASITRAQMVDFLAWLQQEYTTEPDGVAPHIVSRYLGKNRGGMARSASCISAGVRLRPFGKPCCRGSIPSARKIRFLSRGLARIGAR